MNSITESTADETRRHYLLIVHDSVTGRVRIHVPTLYRNQQLRKQLETKLTELAEAKAVSANILTGNLLIEYVFSAQSEDLPTSIIHVLEAVTGHLIIRQSEHVHRPKLPPKKVKVAKKKRKPEAISRYQEPPFHLWHTITGTRAIKFIESDESGLSGEQAVDRLIKYGPNILSEQRGRSSWQMFLQQFVSAPVAMLGLSAVISLATGGAADAIVIVTVVMINSVIGFVTEKSAEKTINALGQLAPEYCAVIRNGKRMDVPLSDVVIGDVLVLMPGTYIAADARLLAATQLSIDESPLTGESMPVGKAHDFLGQEETALGDRQNMVYMGTTVTGGSGRAIVVATGRYSEIGKIQSLVGETVTPETPMQKQIDEMGLQLALLSSAICGLVFVVGLLRGRPLPEMLMSAISLAVAAVPEGLPAVATTTLALGINDMRRHKVLIRQLPAVENLGSVQVICLDKTGTLTLNRMSVVTLKTLQSTINVKQGRFFSGKDAIETQEFDRTLWLMMEVFVLCNESSPSEQGELQGTPTENALLQAAIDAGENVALLRKKHPTVKVDYRAEDRPYMITVHAQEDGRFFIAVKGSPAAVLELCIKGGSDDGEQTLSTDDRQAILTWNERFGADSLRVLGVAYCIADEVAGYQEQDFIWLGLVGMEDMIRPGMEELIGQFHSAGVETVMITGDQSATAFSVGKRLGLNGDHGKPLEIIDSANLDKLHPSVLAGLVDRTSVFARVSPAHKLRIVEALQQNGKVVAMTGDGINDGPALKAANVGVSLGEKGADVARSVADVILEDDDLKTMVTAIKEGRSIYDNIRKSLHFLLSTNLSEIEVMLFSAALGGSEILNPMQLLWINLVTDIFPGLALALDPPEEDVLKRPPRDPQEAIVNRSDYIKLLRESGIITTGTLGVYGYSLLRYGPGQNASTNAFMSLTLAQLLHSYRCRSEKTSIFHSESRLPNRYLDQAVGVSVIMQVLAVAFPPLRNLLRLNPIGAADALAILAGAGLPLIANEAIKVIGNQPIEEEDAS
ncbi:cation-translocating P-type ATPase [Methylomarinum vadi]|uniref:cation-translocating P-type ATPase n=1 Tax=Methylomarinum vadi TaxID=438855 RepID=UPI00068F7988|nr:HAD-IC family P-type ATPase [Methylomarinum vadi]